MTTMEINKRPPLSCISNHKSSPVVKKLIKWSRQSLKTSLSSAHLSKKTVHMMHYSNQTKSSTEIFEMLKFKDLSMHFIVFNVFV